VPTPFEREVTVYWPDADAAGIVWFGHFFRYLEETEEEAFRARGCDRQALLDSLKVWMPRTHLEIGFRSPAKLNDRLMIAMLPERQGERRLAWKFRIAQKTSGAIVCQGSYRVACVDIETFAARSFPDEILSTLGI
jgi:YbgC/YbaW family acyl-CoA thioester hydrolase